MPDRPFDPFHIATLISGHFKGTLDASEEEELAAWLDAGETNREFLDEFQDLESLRRKLTILHEVNEESIWDKTLIGIRVQKPVRKISLWSRLAIAASIIMIIGGGIWFGFYQMKMNSGNFNTVQSEQKVDVPPGSVGATLTLANGRKIVLSDARDGQVAEEAGINIFKTADGQLVYEMKPTGVRGDELNAMNTLTTAKGQTYIITLPDETRIWMNAASRLSFSAGLIQKGLRKVTLDGEAYFEVAKDKLHPFMVESRGQQIEVLGTHFNINSYHDETSVKTTLLEGSVRVVVHDASQSGTHFVKSEVRLKPNQQSILTASKRLSVLDVDPNQAVAWKNGVTSFKDAEIRTIMRQIARWYDIDVKYPDGVSSKLFSGDISRKANLSELIKVIEFSGVRLKLEGRTITVLP